jgi:hypothetical protein
VKIEDELAHLQEELAWVDVLTPRPRPQRSDVMATELLLKKLQAIRIRIDGNKDHQRPHIHIDYGREFHVALYAIETGERIVGDLDIKYDRAIEKWIKERQPRLLEAWNLVQSGRNPDHIVIGLRGEK